MASSFAADLTAILGGDGTPAVLRTYASAYDPVTGRNTRTESDVAIRAAISSYTVDEVAGGLVERGDLKATVAASELAAPPTTASVLVLAGEEWAIKTVTPRYAGGAVLSYALQMRR